MSSQSSMCGPPQITLVQSEGCHFCDDAHRALTHLGRTYALQVDTLDAHTERGRRLMQTHRASMSPLVLVDGEFFSHGRLPRRKLEHLLRQRQAVSTTSVG